MCISKMVETWSFSQKIQDKESLSIGGINYTKRKNNECDSISELCTHDADEHNFQSFADHEQLVNDCVEKNDGFRSGQTCLTNELSECRSCGNLGKQIKRTEEHIANTAKYIEFLLRTSDALRSELKSLKQTDNY
ncbi:hypothetical protein ACOME3_004763 [Neoechinorhynchus agilis]